MIIFCVEFTVMSCLLSRLRIELCKIVETTREIFSSDQRGEGHTLKKVCGAVIPDTLESGNTAK